MACTPLLGSVVPGDAGVRASTDAATDRGAALDASACPSPQGGPPGGISAERSTRAEFYPALARFVPNGATRAADGSYYLYGYSYGCDVGAVPLPGDARPAGEPSVVRYSADGRLDDRFGEEGRLCVRAFRGPTNRGTTFLSGVQDPLGRMVFVGYRASLSRPTGVVMRLTADGRPDPSFGLDGIRELGATEGFSEGIALYDAVAESDGVILSGGSQHQFALSSYGVVLRLRDDGSLDPAFGAEVGPTDRDAQLYSAVIRDDDGYVVAGWSLLGDLARVLRLDRNGRRVMGFGQGGVATHVGRPMHVRSIARAPDGGFVVGGGLFGVPQERSAGLQRFNPDGAPDQTFGDHGTTAPGSGWDLAYLFHPVMAVQCDGRVLLGTHRDALMTVQRWLPNGTRDLGFGVDGERSVGQVGALRAVLVDPTDGMITVVAVPHDGGGDDRLGWASGFWRLRP